MRSGKARAFTYIEILVVITILAIISSVAVLSFGDFGQSRKVESQARQLKSLINLAQYAAVLEPTVIGIYFDEKGYEFKRYQPDSAQWQKFSRRLWRDRSWPDFVTYRLDAPSSSPKEPQIIVYPTGELTPFTLELYYQHKAVLQLEGKSNGELQFDEIS